MLFVIPPWFDYSALVFVYASALLKGGAPERTAAVVFGGTWLFSLAIHDRLGAMPVFETVKDSIRLVVIVVLALRFDRWWLLVGGVTSVLAVATDLAGRLAHIDPWAFGTAIWTWTWIFLAALATGSWSSWRERRTELRLAAA